MAEETERAEERAASREAAADAREAAAAAGYERAEERAAIREASSDARAEEMASVLPGIQAALDGLNQTMGSLIERLDVVGAANEEIGAWRKRATVVFTAAVFLLVVGGIASSWALWEATTTADDAIEDFAAAEAERAETARLENCARIRDAFDLYTQALIASAAEPEVPRSPEEQEAFDARVADFETEVRETLGTCS